MKKVHSFCLMFVFFYFSCLISRSQQVPDTAFMFTNHHPVYNESEGPVVFIDAAHNNFHTKDGGFFGFSRLLEQDGYRVKSLNHTINSRGVLKDCKILVIANPLNAANVENWALPIPSAFTNEEISIIKSWVDSGGSLMLIADHMPFAGAAYDLGKIFGFEFVNGFAFTGKGTWPPSVFFHANGTLTNSPVTNGFNNNGQVDSVATFTGSAFKSPGFAIHILNFKEGNYALLPDTAWQFNDTTPKQDLSGYQQGALLNFGKGKVAVFGEAAMFTAQLVNGNVRVGFNSQDAPQNAQFTLNVVHWLDGIKTSLGRSIQDAEKK